MLKFFGGNGQVFISKKQKKLVWEKHYVGFKIIRKDESAR